MLFQAIPICIVYNMCKVSCPLLGVTSYWVGQGKRFNTSHFKLLFSIFVEIMERYFVDAHILGDRVMAPWP